MSHRAAKRKERASRAALLFVLLLFAATTAHAEEPTLACIRSCERLVTARALRSRICGYCPMIGTQRATWIRKLERTVPFPRTILEHALGDPDWQVTGEAARALARHDRTSEISVIGRWLSRSKQTDAGGACLNATRIGAAQNLTFAAWERRFAGPSRTILKACEPAVREALALEIYGIDETSQREAISHLAALQGAKGTDAVLQAMRERPASTDRIAAKALLLHAGEVGRPVGQLLLEAATPANQAQVNRLVAVYAQEIKALVQTRTRLDAMGRTTLVKSLARYLPLSTPELELMMSDEDPTVRSAAADSIAWGEGGDFEKAVRARVRPPAPEEPAPIAEQIRWIEAYGPQLQAGCEKSIVAELAADPKAPEAVRGTALEVLGSCESKVARRIVLNALLEKDPLVRAGAVTALGSMPLVEEVRQASASALSDPAPEVRVAAIRVISRTHQGGLAERLAVLSRDEASPVRTAAVKSLGELGAATQVDAVAERLRVDPERDVRVAAVEALNALGGPHAVSALGEAAAKDPESRVRFLADRALQRLGFRR